MTVLQQLFHQRTVRSERRRRGRALLTALFGALLLPTAIIAPIFGAGGPAALAASPDPAFACQPGFYQVISGQLNKLNPLTGAYTTIGPTYATYNAMGYNVLDNYLYALSTASTTQAHLLKISSDGSVQDLGAPAGLPAGNYIAGDMDDSGNLIVQSPTSYATFYSIKVAANTATSVTVAGPTGSVPDLVWIGGSLYSASGQTIYRLDLATDTETSVLVSGLPSAGQYGAAFSDRPDELFLSNNKTGYIYQVTGFAGSTPTAVQKSAGTVTNNNDGAACKNADSPFNRPTANDDTYAATTDQTLTVPASTGVLANDSGSQLTAAVTTGSGPTHGALTLASDGSFSYVAAAGYVGSDTFTYTVTDQYNRTSPTPATVTITISLPSAPVAVADTLATTTGSALSLDATHGLLANDSGTSILITAHTAPTDGALTLDADGSLTYTPPAGYSGKDSFPYTITDDYVRTSTATATISVAPVATDDSYSGTGGTPLTGTAANGVLANDTGTDLTATVHSGPTHGTLTLNSDGSFTYTPQLGFHGFDTFSYVATGQDGVASAPATVSLDIATPAAPVAQDDAYTTPSGTPLQVAAPGVFGNDTGTTPHVTATGTLLHGSATVQSDGSVDYTPTSGYSGPDSFTYTISDPYDQTSTATVNVTVTPVSTPDSYTGPAGTPLSVPAASGVLANDLGSTLAAALGSGPAHGLLTLNTSGSFDYIPDAGYAGPDSFTYTATDGDGQKTASTTVSLRLNPPPVPTAPDHTYATDAGAILSVTPRVGVLTGATGTGLSASIVAGTVHGRLTVHSDGSFAYTPDAGFSGADSFTYLATDLYGQQAAATVTLTVRPVAVADSYVVAAGTTLLEPPSAGVLADDIGTGLTVTASTAPTHGSVTVDPNGGLLYAPDAGYSGPDTFQYTVLDGAGSQATGVVAITVSPVARDHRYSGADGATQTVPASAGLLADGLGAGIVVSGSSPPAHGAVTVAADGSFVYTPALGYSGTDTFTYAIADAAGGTASATVTEDVAPVGVPDRYSVPAATTSTVGAASGVLADDLGSGLTATVVTGTGHGTLTLHPDGSFDYTPATGFAGIDTFTYVATDSHGQQTTPIAVAITVAAPGAPAAAPDAFTTATGGPLSVPATSGILVNDSGSGLVVTGYTQPAHGSVTVGGDGRFAYVPDRGYSGPDSFTYTATDPYGRTTLATVRLDVTPAAPDPSGTKEGIRSGSDPAGRVLPFTGFDAVALVGAGLLLMAAGASAAFAGRRRGRIG